MERRKAAFEPMIHVANLLLCNFVLKLRHGRWNRGAEGAAAPPTFGMGEQAIALAPPKV